MGTNRAIGPEDNIERRFFEEKELRDLFEQGGLNNINIRTEHIERFWGKINTVYYLSAEKAMMTTEKGKRKEDGTRADVRGKASQKFDPMKIPRILYIGLHGFLEDLFKDNFICL